MKKVLILVPDGCEEMEVIPLIEVTGWTKVVPDVQRVEAHVAGWSDKIRMGHGTTIVPDIKVDKVRIDEYDAICVPGGWPGTKYDELVNSEISRNLIKKMHDADKIIVTQCFGIFEVGKVGLLKGVQATTYVGDDIDRSRIAREELTGYGAVFVEKAVVVGRRIISSIGPVVADEVALRMLEMLIGAEDTKKVADMMLYGRVTPGDLKWTFPRSDGSSWPKPAPPAK